MLQPTPIAQIKLFEEIEEAIAAIDEALLLIEADKTKLSYDHLKAQLISAKNDLYSLYLHRHEKQLNIIKLLNLFAANIKVFRLNINKGQSRSDPKSPTKEIIWSINQIVNKISDLDVVITSNGNLTERVQKRSFWQLIRVSAVELNQPSAEHIKHWTQSAEYLEQQVMQLEIEIERKVIGTLEDPQKNNPLFIDKNEQRRYQAALQVHSENHKRLISKQVREPGISANVVLDPETDPARRNLIYTLAMRKIPNVYGDLDKSIKERICRDNDVKVEDIDYYKPLENLEASPGRKEKSPQISDTTFRVAIQAAQDKAEIILLCADFLEKHGVNSNEIPNDFIDFNYNDCLNKIITALNSTAKKVNIGKMVQNAWKKLPASVATKNESRRYFETVLSQVTLGSKLADPKIMKAIADLSTQLAIFRYWIFISISGRVCSWKHDGKC